MSKLSTFQCTGYLSVSPSCTGLLYPIFRLGNNNASFVQEVGEDGKIQAFVEFFDFDKFRFVPSHQEPAAAVGDDSIYAFLSRDDVLYEVRFETFGRAVRSGDFKVDSDNFSTLTKLGIARLTASNWDNLSHYLDRYLANKTLSTTSRNLITQSSFSANLNQAKWWSEIDQLEYGSDRLAREFRDQSIEDIFAWLFSNSVDDEWRQVFLVILRRVVTDQRIIDLILKFLEEDPSFEDYDRFDKIIVGRALEVFIFSDATDVDFSDIMFDSIVSGDFFCLEGPVSASTMCKYIEILIRDREPLGDLENIIDSLIDYLLSDSVSRNLADKVMRIILNSPVVFQPYSKKSSYAGEIRLIRLWTGYSVHSRLQLAMSSSMRAQFQNFVVESGVLEAEEEAKNFLKY